MYVFCLSVGCNSCIFPVHIQLFCLFSSPEPFADVSYCDLGMSIQHRPLLTVASKEISFINYCLDFYQTWQGWF